MAEEFSADPERLEFFAEETLNSLGLTRAAVEDYSAGLRAFLAAEPNDLGGPQLTDRGPGILEVLDDLEDLAHRVRDLAERVRVVDRFPDLLDPFESWLVGPAADAISAVNRWFVEDVKSHMRGARKLPATSAGALACGSRAASSPRDGPATGS